MLAAIPRLFPNDSERLECGSGGAWTLGRRARVRVSDSSGGAGRGEPGWGAAGGIHRAKNVVIEASWCFGLCGGAGALWGGVGWAAGGIRRLPGPSSSRCSRGAGVGRRQAEAFELDSGERTGRRQGGESERVSCLRSRKRMKGRRCPLAEIETNESDHVGRGRGGRGDASEGTKVDRG
jgi:hypothetical protein